MDFDDAHQRHQNIDYGFGSDDDGDDQQSETSRPLQNQQLSAIDRIRLARSSFNIESPKTAKDDNENLITEGDGTEIGLAKQYY